MDNNSNLPKKKKGHGSFLACFIIALILVFGAYFAWNYLESGSLFHSGKVYSARDFGIETVKSPNDRDGDGIDDYTDMMETARAYVRTRPIYDGSYFDGGYPPKGRGCCADVIWKALDGAGYDFKAMIDADIASNTAAYGLTDRVDRNIDFRRVFNLQTYFERNGIALTRDVEDIAQWQPGDIIIYYNSADNSGHVAMVSDKRNAEGKPYIIHHRSSGAFEEDNIGYKEIIGHYRFVG